jgi:hypothetical protein
MKTVWKYKVEPGSFSVMIPTGGTVLSVAYRHGDGDPGAFLWVIVDTDKPLERREFIAMGTGHDIPVLPSQLRFVGTFFPSDFIVAHLFEVKQ